MTNRTRSGLTDRSARRPIAAGLLALALGVGCDSTVNPHSVPFHAWNWSEHTLQVTLDGPNFEEFSFVLPGGTATHDMDVKAGDVISIRVSVTGVGNSSSSCRVSSEMIDQAPYLMGQVNFGPTDSPGGAADIVCASGWEGTPTGRAVDAAPPITVPLTGG